MIIIYIWYIYVWTVFLYKEYISVKSMSFWQVSPEGYSCMKSISLQGLFSMNILLVWKSLCKDYRKGPMSVSKGLCLYQGRMFVSRGVCLYQEYTCSGNMSTWRHISVKNVWVWRIYMFEEYFIQCQFMSVWRVYTWEECLYKGYVWLKGISVPGSRLYEDLCKKYQYKHCVCEKWFCACSVSVWRVCL